MRTLKEQIESKCIHFNGLGNRTCNAGIDYDSVKDKKSRPYKVPCLKATAFSGGKNCEKCEFPSDQEVKKRVDEKTKLSNRTINVYLLVSDHIKKTGEAQGIIECPECGNDLNYTKSSVNGHIWAKCSNCETGWIQ